MKKIYYEKIGRRYVPVSEYNSDLVNSFRKGTHLVMCHPGGSSTRHNIDPAYAPMIAAGRIAEDVITKRIMEASEIRRNSRTSTTMNQEQIDAWNKLIEVFGPEAKYLEWPSAREVAEEAVKAMSREAMKLMENESVKLAYEQFQMMCELVKDHHNN